MALLDRFSRKARDQKLAETVAEAVKAGLSGSPLGTSNYNRATPSEPYSTIGGQGIVTGIGQSIPMDRPGVGYEGGYQGSGFGAMLGPAAPLLPAPIDVVLDDSGRALPRRYEFQVATNLNLTQTEVPFQVLKSLAEQCDVIHRAIEIRVGDIVKQDWSFDLSESAVAEIMKEQNCSHAKAARIGREMYGDEINRLTAFWKNPSPHSDRSWSDWITESLWQILTFDQWCIYPRYNLGGAIIGFDIIDAPTIKVLLDNRGDTPMPPSPAYQQILWGFPRGEFVASPESDGDFYNSPGKNGEFKTDQMSVYVKNRRTWSPYGYSPVEEAIPAATTYLDRQAWMRAEYQFGSMPTTFMKTNSMELSLEKLAGYERVLNERLTGSTAERHRIKVLPDGFDPIAMPAVDERYKSDYDEFLLKRIASIFGVSPSSLGVVARAGLGGGKGQMQGEAESSETVSTRPMENYIADCINSLNRRYLDADLNVTFVMQDRQSAMAGKEQADALQVSLFSGQKTLNDVQGELGQALYEMPEADEPFIVAGNSITFLKGLLSTDSSGETIGQQETANDTSDGGESPQTQGQESVGQASVSPSEAPKTELKTQVADELRAFNKYVATRLRKGATFRDFSFTTINEEDAYCFNQDAQAIVKGETYSPPKGVQEAAQRALDWIADGKAGSGFTDVGRKRASDLARGAGVSMATVRRIKAYFDRHAVDKKATGFSSGEEGYPSPGRVAWDAWGGDAGYSWVKGIAGEDKAATVDDTPKGRSTTKRRLEDLHNFPAIKALAEKHRKAMTSALAGSVVGVDAAIDQALRNTTPGMSYELVVAAVNGAVNSNISTSSTEAQTVLRSIYEGAVKAGSEEAGRQIGAEAVLGDRVQQMLGQVGIRIKGINDTTLERIRTTLITGVNQGQSARDMGTIIGQIVNNPTRGDIIATTEANRAYNVAAVDTYQASGATGWDWVAYDTACDECLNLESANPHSFDEDLTPPDHPNCMCTTSAVQENQ